MSRRAGLLALCLVPSLLEGALVGAGLAPLGAAGLAAQANAVPPFGVFQDLRWLVALDPSWTVLAGLVPAVLLARGVLTGLTLAAAWPEGLPRPGLGRLVARGTLASGLGDLLLAPSVVVLYGLAVVPLSWLFLAAVPLAVLLALVAHPLWVQAGWWRRPLSARAVGWVLASFLWLSLAGLAVTAAPRFAAAPVAGLFGAANALAWTGLVRAVAGQPRRRLVVPMVPVALAGLAALVALGTLGGFRAARAAETARLRVAPPARTARAPAGPAREAVLIVSGYGSAWNGRPSRPVPGPFLETRFSYAGLGPRGRPLPYDGPDTAAPLPLLLARLRQQVVVLGRRSHLPVAVVADSEGALLAGELVRDDPPRDLRTVVFLSPLLDPDRLTYPLGGSAGPGAPLRQAMTVLAQALQGAAPVALSPRSPFLASVDRQARQLRGLLACPVPGLRELAVLPLADAVAAPPGERLGIPAVVVPAFHGGMLALPVVQRVVADEVAGRPLPRLGIWRWAAHVVAGAANAWQVPTPGAPSCGRPGR
ncbi:hypothetical protein [Aciditerrimonas ferrireducens]|jgi:hypothetical protein|uniref:hypothetical protein n=1 Tax=Aciditerrimonas ferrireducens TaxID=667306 RepID=UPI002003C387|nr:hypothetical protein [Aciditerrimonas ferrireducens]MCK4176000.1 hypothetical protein [Aciditerrimonas ferrireducens]